MAEGTFATVVNCMDGRTQLPAIEYMKQKYGVDYVDSVTEAGPDGILANKRPETESIKKRVAISVEKHGSKNIAVIGHADCAGNPVGRGRQFEEIMQAVEVVSSWYPGVNVVGLWVGEDWAVEEMG